VKPISESVPHPLYKVHASLRGMDFNICYTVSRGTDRNVHVSWWLDSKTGEDGEGPITDLHESLTPVEDAMLKAIAMNDARLPVTVKSQERPDAQD